jgi:hypothetical protein
MIFQLERERRPAASDANVFGINVDAEIASPLNNFRSQHFRRFPIRYSERNFLVNIIVVLKSRKISRTILGRGDEKRNQYQQDENLPAAQAEHSAEL